MPADPVQSLPRLRVRPFRGWRYVEPEATDALSGLMQRVLSSDDPDRVPGVVASLRNWRERGLLVQDPRPAFYVYRGEFEGHSVVGVVCGISVHPPADRVVLPHEAISTSMVERQARLMTAMNGQPEAVVTVRRGGRPVRSVLGAVLQDAPAVQFSDVAGRHSVWRAQEPSLVRALETVLDGSRLLLADGHHRHAAYRQLGHRLGLAMVVDDGEQGLRLGAIHRVLPAVGIDAITATPGVRVTHLGSGPGHAVRLHRSRRADAPADTCRVSDGRDVWQVEPATRTQSSALLAVPDLAVSRLHAQWLPRWGVPEAEIAYVHDAEEAVALAGSRGGLAVLMPRPRIDAVFDTALRGELLPAKATSFRPKPPVGLVLRHWPGGHEDA
ncbi:MAG: DUF1015 domain-containing protein [Actinomycetota bacterium]|nr:DUF1015 domain-containing protein [Actinomycetota bacterium]